jgi:SAM-dependent methyltransferase
LAQPSILPQQPSTRVPPLVRGLLALWRRQPGDPWLAVDPRDEMLEFLREVHEGDPDQALCAYYRSGREIADVLLQVLRWRFGDALPARSVLDFASGFGRVTRFLLPAVGAERLWVSDVLADGVAFQRAAFGVHGAVSALRPEDLALAETFDAVTVTSLLTHLPEERFRGWLAALWRLLRPGGALLFSTHDVGLHPTLERRGLDFAFEPTSESRSLSLDDYGTTWVSEPFVRAALAAACPGASAARLPRALCNFQDLWVVVPEAGAELAGLAVHGEPEVMVEECTVAGGELSLAGWAVARHGGVERVEVTADGALLAAAPVGAPLPHVAAALGAEHTASGWSCRVPLAAVAPEGAPRAVVALSAVDRRGIAHVSRIGRLEGLLGSFRADQVRGLAADLLAVRGELSDYRGRAEGEMAGLRARIAAMEASRFWKMRNAWFALKRALRLTDER